MKFALETFCFSPSTYGKIYNSGELILPCEGTLRKHLASSFDDETLKKIFSTLPAKQRFFNTIYIYYEVHLKSGLRFNIGHISGTSDYMEEKLATSALLFEMISLHGGPMIVLAVHPVSSLNAERLIRKSFVENNCVTRTLWR